MQGRQRQSKSWLHKGCALCLCSATYLATVLKCASNCELPQPNTAKEQRRSCSAVAPTLKSCAASCSHLMRGGAQRRGGIEGTRDHELMTAAMMHPGHG